MSHPDEESLVLYLLGDEGDRDRIDAHVQECAECGRALDRLQALLARVQEAPVPVPDAGFEDRVWARQQRALRLTPPAPIADGERPASAGRVVTPRFWSVRRAILAGAVAASLVGAFLAGLYMPRSPRPGDGPASTAARQDGRERVLLVAMGDHLERTRMVLVELSNASDPEVFHAQQDQARSLISDNRLYRQTAHLGGQPAVAELLDEVERVLLEVARSGDEVPAGELAWLRQRIADRDLLFKVSVIEGSARQGAGRPRSDRPEL